MKAFPNPHFNDDNCSGMDLRDYFAAVALQGLLATISYENTIVPDEEIVDQSYVFADMMMQARK